VYSGSVSRPRAVDAQVMKLSPHAAPKMQPAKVRAWQPALQGAAQIEILQRVVSPAYAGQRVLMLSAYTKEGVLCFGIMRVC